jgi:hypothetical protein
VFAQLGKGLLFETRNAPHVFGGTGKEGGHGSNKRVRDSAFG